MINSPLGERLTQHKITKAESLISAGTPEHAFDLLAPLVAEPWLPRRVRVLQMLGRIGDERSVALLTTQLSDDEFVIRWAAARALGKSTAIEGADKPWNENRWFCFRCGREFERDRTPPSATLIDFFGGEAEAERATAWAGGVLCTDCERFLCYECAGVQTETVARKPKCPSCGGRLDTAYIDRNGNFINRTRDDFGR